MSRVVRWPVFSETILGLASGKNNQAVPGRLGQFFASPFLRWFGTYSYAMYVFHVAFRPVLRRVLLEPLSAVVGSQYLAVAIFATLAIAVSAGAAFASWHPAA